ncbi:MAG: OmpA family protein [Bacteroidetes bacterium]|nr:OmpA family protein [Bacteroidota bacterium]
MTKYIFSLLFLFAITNVFSQVGGDLATARKKRENSNYVEAAKIYAEYLSKNPNTREVTIEYADLLFFELKDYKKAQPYVKKVLSFKEDTVTYTYALAKCEYFLGNTETALTLFKNVQPLVPNKKDNEAIIDDIKRCIATINYYNTNKDKLVSKYLHVINLGDHVNSDYAEYVPVVDTKENFVMFTSRRRNEFNTKVDYEDDMYHEDMYMSKRQGHDFDTAIALPYEYAEVKNVGNSKAHESIVSLSPDGKTLYIFKEGTLWKSELHNGKWSVPSKLEKNIIADDYANHVTVTADGKTIYFTSEKKGGYGKLDIYYSSKKSDGSWASAENIGNTINTDGNEQSPYISHDGKTLYFSSETFIGYGGYDIFKSTFDGKKWSTPENLGLPFNSVADDIFFAPKDDFSEGFLSTNRNGTIGDFDIYRFYFNNVPDFDKKDLIVIDNSDTSANFGKTNVVSLMQNLAKDPHTENMFYRVNDTLILTNASQVENLIKSGAVKKLDIEQVKQCDTCVYKSTNYYTILNPKITEDTIPLVVNNNNTNTNTTGTSAGEKTFVIYFDFNKSNVSGEAENELKAALAFINANPKHSIILTGHADTRGAETYNQKLSEKRAKAAASYFKNNKIKKSRITKVDGKGETQPAVACPAEPCDESINAKNRRVEIKLVEIEG